MNARDRKLLERTRKEIALTRQVHAETWTEPKTRGYVARLNLSRAQVDAVDKLLADAGITLGAPK